MAEITLHTRYHFKPENSQNYATLYFENTLDDVVIPDKDQNKNYPGKTLKELLVNLTTKLDRCALAPKLVYSYTVEHNRVYPKGTLIAEMDTGLIRMADGRTPYDQLGSKVAIESPDTNIENDTTQALILDGQNTIIQFGTPEVLLTDTDPSDSTKTAAFIVNA